jgi:hypothetical protein
LAPNKLADVPERLASSVHIIGTFCEVIIPKGIYGIQGRIQDFKFGGAHLKKLRRAEGGEKIVGVFRVKNHDFTPKNFQF